METQKIKDMNRDTVGELFRVKSISDENATGMVFDHIQWSHLVYRGYEWIPYYHLTNQISVQSEKTRSTYIIVESHVRFSTLDMS